MFKTSRPKEKGANLVEFAMVMPFLILLLLGIIEFSWLLATNLDVKQGAREGARITAVDTPAGNAALLAEICSRMDLVGNKTATSITWTGIDTDGDGTVEVGEGVTVAVSTPVSTLTNLLNWVFSGLTTLDSTVEIRIEQTPTWTDTTSNCP